MSCVPPHFFNLDVIIFALLLRCGTGISRLSHSRRVMPFSQPASMFLIRSDDAPFTPFTWVHFAFGLFSQIASRRLTRFGAWSCALILLLLHTVYEAKDFYLTYILFRNDPRLMREARATVPPFLREYLPPNSFRNSVLDTVFFALGILVAEKLALPQRFSRTGAQCIAAAVAVWFVKMIVVYAVLYRRGAFRGVVSGRALPNARPCFKSHAGEC